MPGLKDPVISRANIRGFVNFRGRVPSNAQDFASVRALVVDQLVGDDLCETCAFADQRRGGRDACGGAGYPFHRRRPWLSPIEPTPKMRSSKVCPDEREGNVLIDRKFNITTKSKLSSRGARERGRGLGAELPARGRDLRTVDALTSQQGLQRTTLTVGQAGGTDRPMRAKGTRIRP